MEQHMHPAPNAKRQGPSATWIPELRKAQHKYDAPLHPEAVAADMTPTLAAARIRTLGTPQEEWLG